MSSKLRAMAEETVAIVASGGYRSPSGCAVQLADAIAASVAGTRLYLPGAEVPVAPHASPASPVAEVTNETSLAASRRLGDGVVCLVFASAKNPGGGYRVIYSPAVPVFRDDSGTLLDVPYLVSFLTAAAPNLGAVAANQPSSAASVPEVLSTRARRVLEVAAAHGLVRPHHLRGALPAARDPHLHRLRPRPGLTA